MLVLMPSNIQMIAPITNRYLNGISPDIKRVIIPCQTAARIYNHTIKVF